MTIHRHLRNLRQNWHILKRIHWIHSRPNRWYKKKSVKDIQEERLHKWKEYFKNMLGNLPEITDKPTQKLWIAYLTSNQDSLRGRTWRCIEKKNNGRKAASTDEIVGKTRKFYDIFLRLYNLVNKQNIKEKWTKCSIFPSPPKVELRIINIYRGITLTAIPAKLDNTRLLNRIWPETEKIPRKIRTAFEGIALRHRF